jgi:hypothetical protein
VRELPGRVDGTEEHIDGSIPLLLARETEVHESCDGLTPWRQERPWGNGQDHLPLQNTWVQN